MQVQVYLGVWQEHEVAIKLAKQKPITLKQERRFQAQVARAHALSHPNLVQFMGACCWKVLESSSPYEICFLQHPRATFKAVSSSQDGSRDMGNVPAGKFVTRPCMSRCEDCVCDGSILWCAGREEVCAGDGIHGQG